MIPEKPYDNPSKINPNESAQIDINNEFQSSTFMLKSTNQEVDLNEMCVFKFEEEKKKEMEEYLMEFSIWRYAGGHLQDPKVEVDKFGFE